MTIDGNVYTDKLDGIGYAPGYRAVSFMVTINGANLRNLETVELNFNKKDALYLCEQLIRIYELSYCKECNYEPLDIDSDEFRFKALKAKLKIDK